MGSALKYQISHALMDTVMVGLNFTEAGMTRERFADEFRSEAARWVIERGYMTTDVTKCLGVSTQSLYKRAKVVSPTNIKPLTEARES